MVNARRRGDSDDEGAAPPVNHRYNSASVPSGGMSASGASHYSALSAPAGDSRQYGRSMTGPTGHHRHQQSATSIHSGPPPPGSSSASISGIGAGSSSGSIMRSSTSSSRYSTGPPKSTKLPSRWVLDERDRALMSVTSLERTTSFQLGYGPPGDPTCVMAIPAPNSANHTHSPIASCMIVANHSIPVDYLKEIALKNGDQQNGSFAMDDASSGTIDQILSNLRSKPFGVSSTAKRATSASLYPTLPGERGNGNRDNGYRDNRSSSPTAPSRKPTTNNPVYYFEITIQAVPPDATISIGLVVSDGPVAEGGSENPNIPGEVRNSIGLTSKGELKVSGRAMDEKKFQDVEGFQSGDVIGLGLEVLGTRRILFTKNGRTMIQPTRFQDIEPKHNAYSPSLGIVMSTPMGSGAITAVANFGAKPGQSFGWEEADLLNIVNSTLNQHGAFDQKKPPAMLSGGMKYPAINGHNMAMGFMTSQQQPPQQTQYLEQQSAPQMYNFGKPSKRASGGLMAGDNNSISSAGPTAGRPSSSLSNPLPAFGSKAGKGMLEDDSLNADDDADNDNYHGNHYRTGMHMDYQGPQQNRQRWPQGPNATNQTTPEATSAHSSPIKPASPPRGRKNDPPSGSSATKSKGKDPSRSKSPRGLFTFGRSKKAGHDTSTPGSISPSVSWGSLQRKTSSRSSSPAFGKRKKKKDGGLLDEDGDEDDLGQRDYQTTPNTSAQEIPPARRQTPSSTEGSNLYSAMNGHARPNASSAPAPSPMAVPTATVQPATSSSSGDVLFGRKSKKSNLDDDNPTDIELQNQVSSSMSPARNQELSQSPANSGSVGAPKTNAAPPLFFGKKSKKSSLDDDNPADVQLQTAISNSFPSEMAALQNELAGANGAPKGPVVSSAGTGVAQMPQGMPDSSMPLFGKKSKKSSLDDDSPQDVQLQSVFGNQVNGGGMDNSQPPAGSAPLFFGTKSKKSSLDDDNPEDAQIQNSFAQMANAVKSTSSGGVPGMATGRPTSNGVGGIATGRPASTPMPGTMATGRPTSTGVNGVGTGRPSSSSTGIGGMATGRPVSNVTTGAASGRPSSTAMSGMAGRPSSSGIAGMGTGRPSSTGLGGIATGRPASNSSGMAGMGTGRPSSTGLGGIATSSSSGMAGMGTGRPSSSGLGGIATGRPASTPVSGMSTGRPSLVGVGGMASGRLSSTGGGGMASGRPSLTGVGGIAPGRPSSSAFGGVATGRPSSGMASGRPSLNGMTVGMPNAGMSNASNPGNGARTPSLFGSKSKNNSLEDDDAGDIRNQTNAAMAFGSKSKKSSLEDDDPDDDRYQSHSNLPASFNFGNPSKKSNLEDDDPNDDRYQSHSSMNASFNLGTQSKQSGLEDVDNPDDFRYNQGGAQQTAVMPNLGTAASASPFGRPSSSRPQNALFGSKPVRSSLDDDEPSDPRQRTPGGTFGAPSKKGTLEDDNPNDNTYQNHGTMFGASGRNSFSENVEPNAGRHRSAPHGQSPNVQAFMQATSQPGSSVASPGPMFGSRTPAQSEQRQSMRMSMSTPFQGGMGGSSREHRMSMGGTESHTPPGGSNGGRAPGSSNTTPNHQVRDRSTPTSRFFSNGGEKTSSSDAAPSSSNPSGGASEDDMLNKAIEESKRDQKKQELKGQMADSGPLKDPEEIETIRENTRTLRSLCSDERVEASILESLLECCRDDRAKVQACLESDDPQVDLMELLTLNELVLDAIKMGEKVIEGSKKKASSSSSARSSKTNLNLDIGALVEKKDIFSLICILRAQSDQRLDAALALMNFAREADSLAEAGTRSLRDEIRSSGGMHSLITVFRSKGASYELRVVSALAVAYVLPSFVESSSVHPSVGLKIMECLRFLSTSRLVTPNGRRISREEMYKAAAMGVTTFWINELTPMLNSGMPKGENNTAERSDLFSRTSKKGRRKGRTGGQRHQTLELQELLEMTVSLIVQIERLGETESLRKHQSTQTDSLFLWRYTNVEQVCAVDVARPIAVREGLLPILVGWIRSKDREKVRPAVSALRYLTSIKDKYMAGWIHSQMVNEGALAEVVKLADDYYVGQDVRLAVAQILASLCVAPHTRAAVVEAKCINYLIGFLYDHSDKASQDVALFAGSAIMQLAEGAITRASVLGGGDTELQDGASPDKSDTLVDDIVNSGAIGSFIAIAADHEGKLRSMAIEAIRVLSEDTSPNRRTRSQLCEEGAAMALGRALKDGVTALHNTIKPSRRRNGFGAELSLDELHDALCALANILEPIQPGNAPTTKLRFVPSNSDPTQNLIQGCIETAESGGLDSLLWISSLPLTGTKISDSAEFTVQRIDLLEEACRSLASLSPLLLSKEPAAQGYARCADSIFEAFDRILMLDSFDGADEASDGTGEDHYEQEALLELNISALRGLGALATAEPLKIKIVDKTLPCLLQMRNSQGNRSDVSNVTGQVFLSLGFEEDEIAVQVAGSNPNLLADWFCLQRSLIIQAMARSEIRRMLMHIWKMPFFETKRDGVTRLIRETNVRRTADDKVSVDSFAESFAEIDLFESFADDDFTEHLRHSMVRQYHEFYNMGTPSRSPFACDRIDSEHDEVSLLARHMYPLNDTQTEIDWILGHDESIYSKAKGETSLCTKVSTPEHVEALLDCCFPSRLLRNHVVPVFNLRPEATFNFRALTMPQRKYFSFRREGQLISRLCDKQAESLDFDDVHWTLGFMNSTFAGEFSETLVQALYLCPTIRGLSFGKNEDYAHLRVLDGDDEYVEDGSASLANLVGSLPPWIHSLTFSNIFNDREVKTLVGIIETMGKLSSDQVAKASSMGGFTSRGRDSSSAAQTQGKFFSFAICSSPRVSQEVWHSFFSLLGRANALPRKAASSPLSSLKVLDLSFNNLGDDTCSLLLELIHDPESGCSLEQLDLSGNGIRKGTRVLSTLRRYVEHHRYNASSGGIERNGWRCSLHTLNLSANNLGVGKAAVEIVALLKHNALGLKILDLSSNGFDPSNIEYELSHAITSSLAHNTILVNLNLSNNGFSPDLLDDLLTQLSEAEADCGVAFLGLDNNTPPLSVLQENRLEAFLHKSRRFVLQKCLNERDSALSGELMESGALPETGPDNLGYQKSSDLSIIGESTVLANQESDFNKSAFDEVEGQPGDNMITVLFSAPLVFTNERRQLKPFAKLDFDMERELMWQCMKEASRDIELFFDNATHDRLLAAITKRCSCLHYSGHGHPSYLPFEDGGGGPNWFKVEDIQRLIAREGAAPFKFVFVSACHSGLAGETFASAGVPHVVCCQQEFELKDTAALAFTRQFYLSLVIGHTVRESFEQGCKAVRATPNLRDSEKEMKKFLLLPKDGNHDVPIFNARAVLEWPKVNARQLMRSRSSKRPKSITRIRNLHVGGARSSELGVRNMMQEDPSPTPPQFFLGREVEMYYVLKAILCKRLVSVVAEPGLGRSSLVCALCHYINERASTIIAIERIYFVKAKRSRRVDGCRALMEQLLRKLVEAGKEDSPDPGVDMEDLFDFICKALKNEKALVVFDRMEYLENSDDAEEFPMLLSTLFRGTKNVKVLVTGSRPLGIPSLGGQVEYPFPLGPLTFENTLRLFANLCPHLHTAGERHKLFERLATDGEQSELRPADNGISERTKAIFKIVGDGIPSRIEQAAYDISSDNLRDLLDRYG